MPFPYSVPWVRSTSYVLSDEFISQAKYLVKFNKLNYTDVSSIKFAINLSSQIDPMYPERGLDNTAFVELFNITDNVAIANSELQISASGASKTAFMETGDLYASLPDKEIILGFRLKCSSLNHAASAGNAYIFIYKS